MIDKNHSANTTPMPAKNILCELPDYGLLNVRGSDAKKLLQGQLTCDVEKLKPGESTLGAHCNPQGRIISLFYLFQHEEAYYLLMPVSMIPIAANALKKYAIFYKVELTDVSDHFAIKGHSHSNETDAAYFQWIPLPHSSRVLSISKRGAQSTSEKTTDLSQKNAWKILDIEEGLPAIYPETSGKFLPHELALPQLGAVHFEKGCYTGQEIIARMHYRGKLKTLLRSFKIQTENLPPLGSDIQFVSDQGESGNGLLVDACQEAYNHYYALIIMRK